MRNIDKEIKITCPKCGYEYLPNEIFYPDDVFGDANSIVRDENGKIEIFGGDSFNLDEEFTCEHCGCHFNVVGKVSFKTTILDEIDFDNDFVIKLE